MGQSVLALGHSMNEIQAFTELSFWGGGRNKSELTHKRDTSNNLSAVTRIGQGRSRGSRGGSGRAHHDGAQTSSEAVNSVCV